MNRIRALMLVGALVAGTAGAQVVVPPGSSLDVPAGASFDFGCELVDVGGTLNAEGNLAGGDLTIRDGGVVNGNIGTISVAGHWDNSGTFNAGSGTVRFVDGCGASSASIGGHATFNDLTLTSANGRTFVIPAGSSITVNGTLALQGAPGLPIHLVSSGTQLAVINLGPSARVVNNGSALANVRIGPDLTPPALPTSIPTLDEYGKLLMLVLIAVFGLRAIRRSSIQKS